MSSKLYCNESGIRIKKQDKADGKFDGIITHKFKSGKTEKTSLHDFAIGEANKFCPANKGSFYTKEQREKIEEEIRSKMIQATTELYKGTPEEQQSKEIEYKNALSTPDAFHKVGWEC